MARHPVLPNCRLRAGFTSAPLWLRKERNRKKSKMAKASRKANRSS